jgi:hypothetical protein
LLLLRCCWCFCYSQICQQSSWIESWQKSTEINTESLVTKRLLKLGLKERSDSKKTRMRCGVRNPRALFLHSPFHSSPARGGHVPRPRRTPRVRWWKYSSRKSPTAPPRPPHTLGETHPNWLYPIVCIPNANSYSYTLCIPQATCIRLIPMSIFYGRVVGIQFLSTTQNSSSVKANGPVTIQERLSHCLLRVRTPPESLELERRERQREGASAGCGSAGCCWSRFGRFIGRGTFSKRSSEV